MTVKGKVNAVFAGKYRSSFKGKGLELHEVREYVEGDDIRDIDWNTTARENKLYVKTYHESRELDIYLVVDLSGSMFFGSEQLKRDQALKFCATIALSALNSNDKVGLILFTDKVQRFIKAKKGKKHVLHILDELVRFPQNNDTTVSSSSFALLNHISKRHAVCFFVTDILDFESSREFKICSRRNDMIHVHIHDPAEEDLLDIDGIRYQDPECGSFLTLPSNNDFISKRFRHIVKEKERTLRKSLQGLGVDYLSLSTTDDCVRILTQFFKLRISRFH